MTDRPSGEQHVYDWPTSIAVAVGGTAAAVVLIVVFTYLVDWVGSFWSQVVYFLAVFGAVMGLAMIAVGVVVQGDRGILWAFAGYVLVLVGGVGLVMWLLSMAGRRRVGARG